MMLLTPRLLVTASVLLAVTDGGPGPVRVISSEESTFVQFRSQNLLFNRMLQKIVDSLRTWANETIIVRELLKGDVPREAKSQNSSEPIQNCIHHIEQIQKRMLVLSFEDQQKNVLYSIVEFEQAYEILKESWKTKLKNILSKDYSAEARSFLQIIENVRPLKDTRGLQENIRNKSRTADKLQDSSKPATTLRQDLTQLYKMQDHVKLEIKNCTHQIDHLQKQILSFKEQQIKVNSSITKLKHEYKFLRKSWITELQNITDRNCPNQNVYQNLYTDIQQLRSTVNEQETIIMEDTQELNKLQVSSKLATTLEKLPKRLIFLTDPFKWEHSIWLPQSNESQRSPNSEWLYFKQIDPQLKKWRLVGTSAVQNTSLAESHGRVELTDSGSPMMNSTWTYLGKYCWRGPNNCDLQQFGWLVFNQSDSLLKRWRLVISSPINIEGQQNLSEPHTTLEKSHSYIDPLPVDELQDPMKPIKLGQGHGLLALSKPVEYEDLLSSIFGFGRKPNDKNNDDSDSLSSFLSIVRKPNDKNNDDSILSSKNSSFVPKPHVSYNDKQEDAFQDFLNKSRMSEEARGRLILSAPVNQTVNATSEQPLNSEVATISTVITADTQLVDELQDPSTNLGKGLGLLILSDPVDWEGFQRIDRLLTPGATVEHNLEEMKLPTNKNLGQPQLPLKTKEEILNPK